MGRVCTLEEEHKIPDHDVRRTFIRLGQSANKNVVIACLPEDQTGTNSAAAVAVQMKSAFTSIRFGLIVGIGGGVPTNQEADIRLGDVVVSRLHNLYGRAVQYDLRKTTPSGFGFLSAVTSG